MTGKIIKGIAGFYYIHNGQDKVYACKAKGIFRNRGIKPVVGDNVKFTVLDEEALERIQNYSNVDKCAGAPGIGQCRSGAGGFRHHAAGSEFQSSGPFSHYDAGTGYSGDHLL